MGVLNFSNMNDSDEVIGLGLFKLEVGSRKLFIRNRSVFLRNKEFALLLYFMQNAGRVLSRTQILEDVWDRNIFCNTNTVYVHVSSLRQKLRRYKKSNVIRTVHCIGYIFEF